MPVFAQTTGTRPTSHRRWGGGLHKRLANYICPSSFSLTPLTMGSRRTPFVMVMIQRPCDPCVVTSHTRPTAVSRTLSTLSTPSTASTHPGTTHCRALHVACLPPRGGWIHRQIPLETPTRAGRRTCMWSCRWSSPCGLRSLRGRVNAAI